MRLALPLTASLMLSSAITLAQSPSGPPPPACEGAEHRQFDFWLGDWAVTRPDTGALIGRSRIRSASSGCAIYEHWIDASGRDGRSLNGYDRQRKAWVQFWIGSDGGVLRLQGGRQGEAMVLEGEMPVAGGGMQMQRITWTPAADGSVSQHWQASADGGKTWTTSFLGVYRRAPATEPAPD
jgi:hypothetical protein